MRTSAQQAQRLLAMARQLLGGAVEDADAKKDNSFGRGFYPLPAELSGLGRFVASLAPKKLISHKVWPDEGTHMLTTKVDHGLSIMVRDMESLIGLGLVRMTCNEPGTLSFYFQGDPIVETDADEEDWPGKMPRLRKR